MLLNEMPDHHCTQQQQNNSSGPPPVNQRYWGTLNAHTQQLNNTPFQSVLLFHLFLRKASFVLINNKKLLFGQSCKERDVGGGGNKNTTQQHTHTQAENWNFKKKKNVDTEMNITESNSMLDFYWTTDQTPLFHSKPRVPTLQHHKVDFSPAQSNSLIFGPSSVN